MAFDWSSFLFAIAIGIGSGLISGLGTLIINRLRLQRKIEKAFHKAGVQGDFTTCEECGDFVPEETAFCFGCGKPIIGDKECEKCGVLLPTKALFCYLCDGRPKIREDDDDDLAYIDEEPETTTDIENEDI